jgi:hypothetical protein
LTAEEVVVLRAGDFDVNEGAGGGVTIADYAKGVDIGRLAEEAGFGGVIFVDAVNEAGQYAAYSRFIFIEGDLLLSEHKFFEAIFFDAVGDLVR